MNKYFASCFTKKKTRSTYFFQWSISRSFEKRNDNNKMLQNSENQVHSNGRRKQFYKKNTETENRKHFEINCFKIINTNFGHSKVEHLTKYIFYFANNLLLPILIRFLCLSLFQNLGNHISCLFTRRKHYKTLKNG